MTGATPRDPNVLLVVLDSVSARHTSLHGAHRETTPGLERLAEDATVYTGARAEAGLQTAADAANGPADDGWFVPPEGRCTAYQPPLHSALVERAHRNCPEPARYEHAAWVEYRGVGGGKSRSERPTAPGRTGASTDRPSVALGGPTSVRTSTPTPFALRSRTLDRPPTAKRTPGADRSTAPTRRS